MRIAAKSIRLGLAGIVAAGLAACSGPGDQAASSADAATTGGAPVAAVAAKPASGPASWTLPMTAKSLTASDHDAIMKAAGFSKFGKVWAADADSAKHGALSATSPSARAGG